MANHVSNISHLFVILILLAAVGNIGLAEVHEQNVCSQPLGACGPIGDCDKRCKASHNGGQGSCNLGLCTCNYMCGPSPSPPTKYCTAGLGSCDGGCMDNCCNSKCANKFNHGVGSCNKIGNNYLCSCQYICSS
ncbi:Defensin-like protein [Sesbania bispinosa]|nr:Defensin-like protein [Sesbania bispinosa]